MFHFSSQDFMNKMNPIEISYKFFAMFFEIFFPDVKIMKSNCQTKMNLRI